jgi:hypothetical protein
MGGRWERLPARFLACACLVGMLVLWPTVAFADSGSPAAGVKPNHLGIVITHDEVFISWDAPAGIKVAHVYAYRAPTCQGQNGTRIGPTVRARQIIDLSVTPGATYCYTIYVADQAGALTKLGSTGPVTVPDPSAPPPAAVSATPASSPAGGDSGSPAASTIAAMVAAVAGALGLLYLVVRIVRHGRGAPSAPSPAYGTTSRMAAVREQRPALIIPAVIALAWVIVVTAAVVFR